MSVMKFTQKECLVEMKHIHNKKNPSAEDCLKMSFLIARLGIVRYKYTNWRNS